MEENQEEEKSKVPPSGVREEAFLSKFWRSINVNAQADVQDMVKSYEKLNTYNYIEFARIWQANHFTLIFANLTHAKMIKMFCGVLFNAVKSHLFGENKSYARIGAFYFLYGLYYKQPIRKLCQIRITLDEFIKLKDLMKEMSALGQYDAVYIYSKLRCDEAFDYVASPRTKVLPIWPDTNFQIDWILTTRRPALDSLEKIENLFNDPAYLTLKNTCQNYNAKLVEYSEKHPGLKPFKSTLLEDISGIHDEISGSSSSVQRDQSYDASSSVLRTRQRIRQKAMSSQNAQYRGSKEIITAIDLKTEDRE